MPDIGIRTDETSGPNGDGILQKTPTEELIKTISFVASDFASGETIDTIGAITVTRDDGEAVGAGDLVVSDEQASGIEIQAKFTEGFLGVAYNIQGSVLTTEGQVKEFKVRMSIRAA